MIRKKKALWKKVIYIIVIGIIISSIVLGSINLSTNPHTIDKYVFPIYLIILFTLLINYGFRHPIKLKLKIRIDGRRLVRSIFKYGLMLGIVYAIPHIVFGIVNLTLPPEELSLLKTNYDFFIPSIIFLIVISCIGFIVVYLLLFGRINRKIKKRNI